MTHVWLGKAEHEPPHAELAGEAEAVSGTVLLDNVVRSGGLGAAQEGREVTKAFPELHQRWSWVCNPCMKDVLVKALYRGIGFGWIC